MTTKASSGSRKHGRSGRSPAHKRYNAGNRRFTNKLKRVRQSEGEEAAERYSRKYKYAPVAPLDWRKREA
jgi:hypothetical protein